METAKSAFDFQVGLLFGPDAL